MSSETSLIEKRARLKQLLVQRKLAAQSAPEPAAQPENVLELHRDAKLDLEIEERWHAAAEPRIGNCDVLLTGATGFLGAFLLDELLGRTDKVVHCLVRANSISDATARIQENLERYQLHIGRQDHRIVPVCGDLTQPLLGLDQDVYDNLADRIGAVYHNGAAVNMFTSYPILRPTNVIGTQEVLRFAASNRQKRFHFVSALSVFPLATATTFTETEPLGPVESLTTPYGQSKWVAETLIEQAAEFGMSTRVYRPGQITGHSVTGASPVGDLLFELIQSSIRTRMTMEIERSVDLTPVDYVAAAIIHLAELDDPQPSVYHLCNNERVSWLEFIEYLQRFGFNISVIPFSSWQDNLQHRSAVGDDQSGKIALMADLAGRLGSPSQSAEASQALYLELPTFDATNTLSKLEGSGIACHPPTEGLVHRYLDDFVAKGAVSSPE